VGGSIGLDLAIRTNIAVGKASDHETKIASERFPYMLTGSMASNVGRRL
jgi:hypothetical protein